MDDTSDFESDLEDTLDIGRDHGALIDLLRGVLIVTPEPVTRRRHLAAMLDAAERRNVPPIADASVHPRHLGRRVAVVLIAAVLALAALGTAGALPGPVQDVVAGLADAVGIDLPSSDAAPGARREAGDLVGDMGEASGSRFDDAESSDPAESLGGQGRRTDDPDVSGGEDAVPTGSGGGGSDAGGGSGGGGGPGGGSGGGGGPGGEGSGGGGSDSAGDSFGGMDIPLSDILGAATEARPVQVEGAGVPELS